MKQVYLDKIGSNEKKGPENATSGTYTGLTENTCPVDASILISNFLYFLIYY